MGDVPGPLARSEGLLVESIGDELLVYDEQRRVAHSLNETATLVWRACDGRRDLGALEAECGLDRATVRLALERLRGADLLAAGQAGFSEPERREDGVSRRAILRRGVLSGAGVGLAIPMIRSITAPSVALAASNGRVKGKAGQPCTSAAQCSSGPSFCNTSFQSCNRLLGASCSHTSSCDHVASVALVCRGGICTFCTSNGQCPASHPHCNAGNCQ